MKPSDDQLYEDYLDAVNAAWKLFAEYKSDFISDLEKHSLPHFLFVLCEDPRFRSFMEHTWEQQDLRIMEGRK